MTAYSVGIDLGTTHTVMACTPVGSAAADAAIELFAVEQLVAPGEVAALPLLPSLRYHPAPGELAAGELVLPWLSADAEAAVVGELARRLGARVPGRLVASAKSWLSHDGVDRLAPILPWGADDGVPKVSPVAASASYLAHLRAAWNHRHPAAPLERQDLVLTVPASFDDAARAYTLEAAREAGLPALRLLEEPQAALYDWLFRHRAKLADELAQTKLVLVCDVGGGTTDLSLVRVDAWGGEPRFERVAVGSHLMLGGDNMDLALARLVESRLGGEAPPRLGAGQWSQLLERCRAAKERLLSRDAPDAATVTLLGTGSRLVGGASSAELRRDEVERIVVDGFFPHAPADELPRRGRAGSALVAFGLPYAGDPAVTRHLAAFLRLHADAGRPDALLLNGGVFRADAIARRLQTVLADWCGAPLRLLHNADPDVAVARGAVAYALARRGLAPRIGGGSPRSYFLPVDGGAAAHEARRRGVCVLPRGSEEGREIELEGRRFGLRVGEPVRFHLVSTTGDAPGRDAPPQAGELVDLDDVQAEPLPPLATVVRAGSGSGAVPPRGRRGREIPVRLAAMLTEVGTLELHCIDTGDLQRRWRLEFQLRTEGVPAPAAAPGVAAARLAEAVDAIDRVFGSRDRGVGPKEAKQLRSRLEALLGNRERWPTELLRALFDALWPRARGRHRSADHERLWLSLAGWCLRPGFGDALDGWRVEQLWTVFEAGVQHGRQPQVNAEWWTLWRRVAGGLDEAAQRRLLDDFALNLRGDEAGAGERPPRLVSGGWDDMVRLGASLERIAAEHKGEIGDWLLERLGPRAAPTQPPAQRLWTLWAIGRLGARVPLYGSAHAVVPTPQAAGWLETLLAFDWARIDGAAAAAANLARLSGDRARDLPPELRERVAARLVATHAPPGWIERLREAKPLDEAARRSMFGESLPPGLRLVD